MRLWGGRFEGTTDERMAEFTRSIDFDHALAVDDIAGSIAHVHGLGRAGLLAPDEVETLVRRARGPAGRGGGRQTRVEPGPRRRPHEPRGRAEGADRAACRAAPHRPLAQRSGRHRHPALAAADARWPGRLDPGDGAGPRGAGRSRRRGSHARHATHIQPAQPVLFAHHLLAYVEMLERDRGRLADCRQRANVCPLGSGALAGAGYPLDREATAAELGFDGVTANSLDARQRPRLRRRGAGGLRAVHGPPLSRLAEEITWWSNPRFGFVRAADAYSTGSSMMPNKKNPDPAELVRGKGGPGHRLADRPAGAAEGPAAGLSEGHAGGQAAAVRSRGHPGGVAGR